MVYTGNSPLTHHKMFMKYSFFIRPFLYSCLVFFISSFLYDIGFCQQNVKADAYIGIYKDAISKISSGQREEGKSLLEQYIKSSDREYRDKAVFDLMSLYEEEGLYSKAMNVAAEYSLPENTFFAQFEKGWNLLSAGQTDAAVKSFTKSKAFTANQSYLSQADFAISLAEARRNNLEKALETMAYVYTRYPYMLSAASHILGNYLDRRKEYERSLFFLSSSLEYDSNNFQAEADFASVSEKKKNYTPAWQAWRTLKDLDPLEKRYDAKLKKLSKHVKGEKDNLMYWQRMNWPVHTELRTVHGGNKVSVSLYSSPEGKYSELLEFSFMANSDFEISDDVLGHLMSGKKLTPWKILYNAEEKTLEIHDSRGSSVRSTYGNITISSINDGAIIMIKDPLFATEIPGVNRGDKEAGGQIKVIKGKSGFSLKTVIDEESLACPITASMINRSYETEFAKAAAVAARTRIREYAAHPRHEDSDMCDSSHCIEFSGMQTENIMASAAVSETSGQVLVREDGSTANISWIRACGGVLRMCQDETDSTSVEGNSSLSPFEMYVSFVSSPSEQLLCIPESKLNYIDLNWTVLLDPKWIEYRVNRHSRIGRLKSVFPLKRDSFGRVTALRAVGTKGNADFEGEDKVNQILAAGSLRSSIFSIRPVNKGKFPEYFIVRGRGTMIQGQNSFDSALCLRGAEGMAIRKNVGYKEILSHYFPKYILSPKPAEPEETDKH